MSRKDRVSLAEKSPLPKLKSIPLYLQLEDDLKKRIENGHYLPGQAIPSESDLVEMYGVSRITVREAISRLAAIGYLKKERGKGTFVQSVNKLNERIGLITSFTEEIRAKGREPKSLVISLQVEKPPKRVAAKLQLEEKESIIVLERLRFIDDEPFSLTKDFVPERLVPGFLNKDFKTASLYHVLESDYGFAFSEAIEELEATIPTKSEARLLRIHHSAAVIQIHRVVYGGTSMGPDAGKPVTGLSAIFRGDRFQYWAKLTGRRPKTEVNI